MPAPMMELMTSATRSHLRSPRTKPLRLRVHVRWLYCAFVWIERKNGRPWQSRRSHRKPSCAHCRKSAVQHGVGAGGGAALASVDLRANGRVRTHVTEIPISGPRGRRGRRWARPHTNIGKSGQNLSRGVIGRSSKRTDPQQPSTRRLMAREARSTEARVSTRRATRSSNAHEEGESAKSTNGGQLRTCSRTAA